MSICSTALGDFEPLVVSPKRACQMLDCSMTKFYELSNSGEIATYHEGKSLKAIVASIKELIARRLEQEAVKEPSRCTERATSARIAKRSAKAKARRLEQEADKEPSSYTERATGVRMAERSAKAKAP